MMHGTHDIQIKCVLFGTTLAYKTAAILRRIHHTLAKVYKLSVRYSCRLVMKLEYSRQFFEKYSNIKCHENFIKIS
jgi:MinD superfamily P-loop ATPase